MRELSQLWPGRSDVAAQNALGLLERLAEAKVIPLMFEEGIKRLMQGRQRNMLSYLAHEYLNEHWKPAYHAEVARAFARAKLSYAGSTELLRNFNNLGVNETQRKLIADIPIAELRETLRDGCMNNWFRQDVFVRGARRMSEARRQVLLRTLTMALIRPAPPTIEITCPDATIWRPDPAVYEPVIKALEKRPHTVGELLALPSLPAAHRVAEVELVGVLIGTGLATLFHEAGAEAQAACARLNVLVEGKGEILLAESAILAVPNLGAALTLGAGEFALYRALRSGQAPDPHALARSFVRRCKEEGGHPIVDGKAIEDETEAHVAVARDYESKIERLVPIWRMIGLVA